MIVPAILVCFSVLSLLLLLWQWYCAVNFPLHQRSFDSSGAPPVTLLKPLKGADAETAACLESWLRHDYPGEVQILFGVASADDPAFEVARQAIAQSTRTNAEVIVCTESLGPNAKVSTLIQLERLARHDIIIVSDADVRVPEDFLANVVQPLENPHVGLVNCFYAFANPTTLAMQWEAIAVNADFWSQVLQSQSLKPIDFALGAVMAARREDLQAIGGFSSLVDFLADDYQFGNRIAKTGKHIVISPVVVECWEAPKDWKQIWAHQLRWARTIRACQPVPFFFSILSNATLWPVLLFCSLALTKNSFSSELRFLFMPLLIFLPVRMFAALKMQELLKRDVAHYAYFWLIPVKDLLAAVIWALAFFGNAVEWRGERFKVLDGGKLLPLGEVVAEACSPTNR